MVFCEGRAFGGHPERYMEPKANRKAGNELAARARMSAFRPFDLTLFVSTYSLAASHSET